MGRTRTASDSVPLKRLVRNGITITMSQFCEHRNSTGDAFNAMAFIGVGANLPGREGSSALATCRRGVAMLDSFPEMRLCGLSRWFVSAPVPPSGQPPYVNAVAALRIGHGSILDGVALDPAILLARLMAVETAC